MHPPACPMALSREHNSLTVSNLSLSIIALVEKGLSAPAKVEQVLQINSLQFLKFSLIPVIFVFLLWIPVIITTTIIKITIIE